ncbi:hypothetical protein B4135_1684 [Caldibacillus debilis]|uniref:Uncharacterized protein n=1 Tax=Caldibacillus debilis TaxID=301148 RepID=A0A150M9P1_9BACI|nr:hypothetical protein B4135_1684 [Caldibacillus debilis]
MNVLLSKNITEAGGRNTRVPLPVLVTEKEALLAKNSKMPLCMYIFV